MTLCKEEGPRHPIFFTMNKFKPQSLISSVLFGCVLLHRPRHFQLMELQSSSISGNPTSKRYDHTLESRNELNEHKTSVHAANNMPTAKYVITQLNQEMSYTCTRLAVIQNQDC